MSGYQWSLDMGWKWISESRVECCGASGSCWQNLDTSHLELWHLGWSPFVFFNPISLPVYQVFPLASEYLAVLRSGSTSYFVNSVTNYGWRDCNVHTQQWCCITGPNSVLKKTRGFWQMTSVKSCNICITVLMASPKTWGIWGIHSCPYFQLAWNLSIWASIPPTGPVIGLNPNIRFYQTQPCFPYSNNFSCCSFPPTCAYYSCTHPWFFASHPHYPLTLGFSI